jgi:cation:H+ antiporter
MGQRPIFLIALTMLLTGILTMGLLRRERAGFANIGLEGVLILVCYAAGSWLLFYL